MDQLPDIKILPGMAGTVFGRGKKLKEESAKGIIVPASAIFTPTTEKQSYVWILDEKAQTVSQKPVDVGPPTIGGIRLTGDLSPGQWVVTAGVHSLTEGQQVKLLSGGKE